MVQVYEVFDGLNEFIQELFGQIDKHEISGMVQDEMIETEEETQVV